MLNCGIVGESWLFLELFSGCILPSVLFFFPIKLVQERLIFAFWIISKNETVIEEEVCIQIGINFCGLSILCMDMQINVL